MMHFTILLALMLLSTSCDKLRNSSDRIGVECGIDQGSVGPSKFVKLLSPEGSAYQAVDVPSLKAIFTDEQGQRENLALTPNACVMLPAISGVLLVLDARNGDSTTQTIKSSANQPTLSSFNLVQKQELQVALACPEEGLFAASNLKQPLFVTYTGDVSGLNIRLDAVTSENSLVRTLIQKPLGQSRLNFPDSLDVSDLMEGSYFLRIYGFQVSEGIDAKPRPILAEKNCRLNILRGTVKIGGLEGSQKSAVYPPQTILPWNIQAPHEKLYVCQEKRGSKLDMGTLSSTSCQTANSCSNPLNFHEVPFVKTGDAGVFDFYAFAENKAGIRSPISCQTIIVSPEAPLLTVGWDHEDLQKNGSILRKPYALLKAHIDLSHSMLGPKDLEQNLSCKVALEVRGRFPGANHKIRCAEGRCKGQLMNDFVPCDTDLSMNIVEALDQPSLLMSRLVLTVKADDGAGHIAETQRSLWINQTAWELQNLVYLDRNTSAPQKAKSFLVDESRDVIASFGHFVATYRNNAWVDLLVESKDCDCSFQIMKDRNNTVLIARKKMIAGLQWTDLFAYKNGLVEQLTSPDKEPKISACEVIPASNRNAFCVGSLNKAYSFENGIWNQLPPAAAENETSVQTWRLLSDGRLMAFAKNSLFFWDGTRWNPTVLPLTTNLTSLVVEDFKSRLWLILIDSKNIQKPSFNRIEGQNIIPYPAPSPLLAADLLAAAQNPSQTTLKSLTIGNQTFDFSRDQWAAVEPLAIGTAVRNEINQNFVAVGRKGFLEAGLEPLYWPIKALSIVCEPFCSGMQRDNDIIYFFDKTNEESHILGLKPIRTASFNSRMLDIQDTFTPGNWIDNGFMSFLFNNGRGINIFEDRVEYKTVNTVGTTLSVTPIPVNRYCISDAEGLSVYDQSMEPIQALTTKSQGQSQNCSGDRWGNVWWSNFTENKIYRHDGTEALEVPDLGGSVGETIVTVFAGLDSSRILVATPKRIVLLQADRSIDVSFLWEQKITRVYKTSEKEVLVRSQAPDGTKFYHTLQLDSGKIQQDSELEKFLGSVDISRLQFLGDKVVALVRHPDATVLRRSQGRWQVLANYQDMKPFLISGAVPPYQLAIDPFDRVWMHTQSPNNLIRLDPEWNPKPK